jgi:hypothetical protein
MNDRKQLQRAFALALVMVLQAGCGGAPVEPTATPMPTPIPPPTDTPAPTPGPLDIIKVYESAMIRGDTDGALDLFVDEGLRYEVWGAYAEDKESLRYWLDFFIGVGHPDDTHRDCQSAGEEVVCIQDFYDGVCLEAFGLDVMHFEITFAFQNGKIRAMSGDIVNDEKVAFYAAKAKKDEWAAENVPEMWQEFLSFIGTMEGSGRELAELDLEICGEYLEAMSK